MTLLCNTSDNITKTLDQYTGASGGNFKNRDTATLRIGKNLLSQLEHKNCPNIETVLTLLNTYHNYKGDLNQIL